MRLFVTGGTGFVGSHFVAEALARGHAVRALRRPGGRTRIALPREPEWIEGSLDGDHRAALAGCDVLVHLAAHTPNPPYDTLERCRHWNVDVSLALARQARAAGIDRFVVAGTCFEYGAAADRYLRVPVDAPLEALLSYPRSKAEASEAFLALARGDAGLRLQILRIFQVYGEGEAASRFWPSLRAAALAGRDFPMSPGLQVRDFVEVREVARQFADALAFDGVAPGAPRIAHVASGHAQTLLDFARHWWAAWQARGELRAGALPMREGETMRLVPELAEAATPAEPMPAAA